MNNLLAHFPGLDRSLLPLFATLLGNDFVDAGAFSDFLFEMEPPETCKWSQRGRKHLTIISLLHWMQTAASVEDAISQVLAKLKPQVRDGTEKLLRASVAIYADFASPFVSHLERGSQLELLDSSGAAFPQWFADHFFSGLLNAYLLDVVVARKVFHNPQIECFEEPSIYSCSLALRKVLFGLALGAEGGSGVVIEVTQREGESITTHFERPSYEVPTFGKLPKLKDIEGLRISKRRELFDRILQFDGGVFMYPTSLHTMVAVIFYWVKNASPAANENLVRSLLVNVVLLRLHQRSFQSRKEVSETQRSGTVDSNNPTGTAIQEVLPGIQDEDLTDDIVVKTCKNFAKFFSRCVHSSDFDADLVYSYNQLQTCMYTARCLNRTLLRPYEDVMFHRSLNGTFLYNFTRKLDSQPRPDFLVAEYLVRGSPLEIAFSRFYRKLRQALPDLCFEVTARQPRRARMSDTERTDDLLRSLRLF